jgi:uncharacterized protein (TIGR00297 family)
LAPSPTPAALEKRETAAAPSAAAPAVAEQGAGYSPPLRAAVHFAALIFAFPFTWIAEKSDYGRLWAAGGCLLLALFNLYVLKWTVRKFSGRKIERLDEGTFSGLLLYPLSLAAAFLVFPPYAVGAAWAALAAGDAAAATLGSLLSRPALPWNPKKSWVGTLGFAAVALPFCALLLWWRPAPEFLTKSGAAEWQYVWTLAVIAAVLGALLESLRGPFDDNLRVVLGTGALVWLAASFLNVFAHGMPAARAYQPAWFLHALAVNAGLGLLVWALKLTDAKGAIAGAVLGTLIYFMALPAGYVLVLVFVLCGAALTHFGRAQKEARGTWTPEGGRRSAANVLANLTVPALSGAAYSASGGHPAALLAFAGAVAAAFADTASAEVGVLARDRPRLITTGAEVPHGTNGGVTILGYGAAFAALILLCAAAWLSGFWSVAAGGHEQMWRPGVGLKFGLLFSGITLAAGLLGCTVDSLLGATLEGKYTGVNKHSVNFVCTLFGAGAGAAGGMLMWLAGWVGPEKAGWLMGN